MADKSSYLNKSASETDINALETLQLKQTHASPYGFVSSRVKRKRDDNESEESIGLREEMQNMCATLLAAQEREFKKNSNILQGIQQTTSNIEGSISFLMAQNEEFKQKIATLENKIKDDHKYIAILEDRIENMQQDNRKANFELKNVPKKQNETKNDLIDMVLDLSNSVGSSICRSDIRDIYRVRGKSSSIKNTPIVVETSSTLVKNDLLRSCKAFNMKHKAKLTAKHLGFRTSEDTPIFINEQLTAKAARLHFLARDLVKAKSYKFCWTAYGRVYVRKDENSPVISIKSEAQIHHLLEK